MDKPTTQTLWKLSTDKGEINVIKSTKGYYKRICSILLKDDGGELVDSIHREQMGREADIILEIYKKWMRENPNFSWTTLAVCFRDCELESLANSIEQHFGLPTPKGELSEELSVIPNPKLDNRTKRVLYRSCEQLREAFSTLICNIGDYMHKEQSDVKLLATHVLTKMNIANIDIPQDFRNKIDNCTRANNLHPAAFFEVLTEYRYIRFYSIAILEYIIMRIPVKEDTIKSEFHSYKTKLARHLRMRIYEHNKYEAYSVERPISSPADDSTLYIITDELWADSLPQSELFHLQHILETELEWGLFDLQAIKMGSLVFCFEVIMRSSLLMNLGEKEIPTLLHYGVGRLRIGNEEHKEMGKEYKAFLDNYTRKMLPSMTHPADWKGALMDQQNISAVIKRSLVSSNKDLSMTQRLFNLSEADVEGVSDVEIEQKISKKWHSISESASEESGWWKLGMKLIRCCREEGVVDVHGLIKDVVKHNNKDAPIEYVLEVLPPSSPIYKLLINGYEEQQLKNYLEENPKAISWKSVAVLLYRHGDNNKLDMLFEYLKSPEDLSFVFPKVENVLSAEGNDGEKFAIFCQELHSIPPPNDGRYNMMGIKLWILTSPLRTWVDLAWALYRSCMDTALKEAKQNITVEEGDKLTPKEALRLFEKVDDENKRETISRFLRHRKCDGNFEAQKDEWLKEWSGVYPNTTKTVLYQALIYGGEHAIAREVFPEGVSLTTTFSEEDTRERMLKDIMEALDVLKSWPVFYHKLTGSIDCSEDRKASLTVYMEQCTVSWRDIAKASYACGEHAVMNKLFQYIEDDSQRREIVHQFVTKHVKEREDFNRFYEEMMLEPLPESMPVLAGIDLWLLTCPFSWRELGWSFYKCQIHTAVVEIKKVFIEDNPLPLDTIIAPTKPDGHGRKKVLLLVGGQAEAIGAESRSLPFLLNRLVSILCKKVQSYHAGHPSQVPEPIEATLISHPFLSWSILISVLLKAKENIAANYLLQNVHVKGCILTTRTVEIVLKLVLLRDQDEMNWEKIANHFTMPLAHISDNPLTNVERLAEHWYDKEEIPLWSELHNILFKCCAKHSEDIRFLMNDIQEKHYVNDAYFHEENIMKALNGLRAWESFYFSVTGNHIYKDIPDFTDSPSDRASSLKAFMRTHPGKISWVNLAEAAYLCREETVLEQLSDYMKSPRDPTLSYRAVKVLLEKHNIPMNTYAGLNAELGVPLLTLKCSNCFGIRLWLLRDPSVSWTDLAVALYNLNTPETDSTLLELKKHYLPNTDSTFNLHNLQVSVQDIDNWKFLGFLIGDRNSQDNFTKFSKENRHVENKTQLMLKEWYTMHPYASWTLLYEALSKMNEVEMSEQIKKQYLSDEDRSIDAVAMSCVFSGAPRSGKTTIVKRLKGEQFDINETSLSTGVIDEEKGVTRIDIVPSCNIVTDQDWMEMTEDDEIQAFLNLTIIPQQIEVDNDSLLSQPADNTTSGQADEKQYGKISGDTSETTDKISDERTDETIGETADDATDERMTEELTDEMTNGPNDGVTGKITEEPGGTSEVTEQGAWNEPSNASPMKNTDDDKMIEELSPMSVLKSAQRHNQQIRATRRLCKCQFLLLSDTGGQPELRKMIPLLLPQPSCIFIVFRIIDKFESSRPVALCYKKDGSSKEYSSYSLTETINDIIMHIYCSGMQSKGSIMFIGTHKDQIEKEMKMSIDRGIMHRNDELRQILSKSPYYQEDMVIKSDHNSLIFCVDNSHIENEHKRIKSIVSELLDSDRYKVQVKPEYLLLALTLRGAKSVTLTLKMCKDAAMQCGVSDVDEALCLLHEKLMVIRMYEIGKDDVIIVVKPRALINKVSHLLKYMITREDVHSNPVVSYGQLQKIAASGEYMKAETLRKILEHLLIIAPMQNSDTTVTMSRDFIIPSMFPDSIPRAVQTGVKPSIVPSICTISLQNRSQPDELLFAFRSFKFSIPSTLHGPVLCSLLQGTQLNFSIQNCTKTCIVFSNTDNANIEFTVTLFKECVSLCVKPGWNLSAVNVSGFVMAAKVLLVALERSLSLVGYGTLTPSKYCSSCFEHYLNSDSEVNFDCTRSHIVNSHYPQNVWFSEKYRSLTTESALVGSTPSTVKDVLVGGLSPGADERYNRFLTKNNGILFEDEIIQIGVKSEYKKNLGRLVVFYGNKSTINMTNVAATITGGPSSDCLYVQVKKIHSTVEAGAQYQQLIDVECRAVFFDPVILDFKFHMSGDPHSLVLKLPVMIYKFMEPATMTTQEFFQRWKKFSNATQESQKIFPAKYPIEKERSRTKLKGFGLSLLEGVDPNPDNSVLAGVLNTSSVVLIGCLLRLEPNPDTKMYRLTVRTSDEVVSKHMCSLLADQF